MFAVQNSSENVIDNLDTDSNSSVIFQTVYTWLNGVKYAEYNLCLPNLHYLWLN